MTLSTQEEPQPLGTQIAEPDIGRQTRQGQLQHPAHLRHLGHRRRAQRVRAELGRAYLDRPQRQGIGRMESAGLTVDRLGLDLDAGGDLVGPGEIRLRTHLYDRHRRDRGQVVRVKHPQQRVAELGEIVVEFMADAGVEVGKGLDQPLDMRVFDGIGADAQPRRDLRVGLGELRRQLADLVELIGIVGQQFLRHRWSLSPPPCR